MNHRWALIAVAVCALTAAGCSDDNDAAPSNLPLVFSASLSPANEVPPVGNAESAGRGATQIQFNVTRASDGTINTATADFYFQVNDFPPGTTIVGAHIHPAPAGANGPIVVPTGVTSGNTLPLPTGTGEFTIKGIPVDPALAQAIANNPSAYYFNLHSTVNPGGFSRGQLRRIN